jgi:hypothetical protein
MQNTTLTWRCPECGDDAVEHELGPVSVRFGFEPKAPCGHPFPWLWGIT